jgi:hypothetical protein
MLRVWSLTVFSAGAPALGPNGRFFGGDLMAPRLRKYDPTMGLLA